VVEHKRVCIHLCSSYLKKKSLHIKNIKDILQVEKPEISGGSCQNVSYSYHLNFLFYHAFFLKEHLLPFRVWVVLQESRRLWEPIRPVTVAALPHLL